MAACHMTLNAPRAACVEFSTHETRSHTWRPCLNTAYALPALGPCLEAALPMAAYTLPDKPLAALLPRQQRQQADTKKPPANGWRRGLDHRQQKTRLVRPG